MKALNSLQEKFQEDYKSTFEFNKYNIDEDTKREVIENEALIFRNFRTMSESMYKVCKALYETSVKLKADKSFQAWYENIGLGKDKVSELLKRYDLYIKFPKSFQYVTELSNQAVKLLTAEKLDSRILYDAVEGNIRKVEDIKEFIENRTSPKEDVIDLEDSGEYKVNPLVQKETKKCVNYKSFEKLKKNISNMDAKQVIQTEKELELVEAYIKELRKNLSDRGKCFDNAGALKIEFDDVHPLTQDEIWLLMDIKGVLDYSWLPGATTLSVKITTLYNSNRDRAKINNQTIDDIVNKIKTGILAIEDKTTNENFVKQVDWNKILDDKTTLKQRIEIYKNALDVLKELNNEN
ncbi:MAG: hypothetical protein ACRDDK_05295 [Cetobacterium sp.]|uniref:hypothetical protein n=1 Tax=Cetobacterium sp. TaxID=2071632 RepID=UPI003EE48500